MGSACARETRRRHDGDALSLLQVLQRGVDLGGMGAGRDHLDRGAVAHESEMCESRTLRGEGLEVGVEADGAAAVELVVEDLEGGWEDGQHGGGDFDAVEFERVQMGEVPKEGRKGGEVSFGAFLLVGRVEFGGAGGSGVFPRQRAEGSTVVVGEFRGLRPAPIHARVFESLEGREAGEEACGEIENVLRLESAVEEREVFQVGEVRKPVRQLPSHCQGDFHR